MEKNTISIIYSSIAIFISLVAIYTTRPYNWESDFVGLTITILSFLVTLLIGWNIFQVVDIKGRITKIKEEQDIFIESVKDDIDSIKENFRTSYNENKMFLFYLQGETSYINHNDKMYLEKYRSFQSSLYYAVQEATDTSIDGIRIALSCMKNCLDERDKIISKELKEDIIIDIESYNNEVDFIATSGNRGFSKEQRAEFSKLTERVSKILEAYEKTDTE